MWNGSFKTLINEMAIKIFQSILNYYYKDTVILRLCNSNQYSSNTFFTGVCKSDSKIHLGEQNSNSQDNLEEM